MTSGTTPSTDRAAAPGDDMAWRVTQAAGAIIGYGSLAAFLCVVGAQILRWFRDGEWTHFGVGDGLRMGLARCCVREGETGRLADMIHWLDAPTTWLGLHKVLELVPASLLLFAVSIAGNCIYIYCRDHREEGLGP